MSLFSLRHNPVQSLRSNLYDLPCPSNISYFYAIGSTLSLFFVLQVVTGLSLAFFYLGDSDAFSHSIFILREINNAWLFRLIHANGASILIFLIFIHIGRSLFVGSYSRTPYLMLSGWLLILLMMAAGFTGYVLPWGQISYWAATVILNMLSSVPYIGEQLLQAVWGGPIVSTATLGRLFTLHFLLPLAMFPLIVVHLALLHVSASSNPLGIYVVGGNPSAPIHPYFTSMDLCSFSFFLLCFTTLVLGFPHFFALPENIQAPSALSTPPHILPEWYFLPFYAVIRASPTNSSGVVMTLLLVVSLAFLPFVQSPHTNNAWISFSFFINLVILTWLGGAPLEQPYILLSWLHGMLFLIGLLIFSYGESSVGWSISGVISFLFFLAFLSGGEPALEATSAAFSPEGWNLLEHFIK